MSRIVDQWAPVALVLLALVGFSAQVFCTSAEHRYPRWDEVQYLALARDYAREGGALATIRCHLEGRCREDIRHPLYQLPLQAVVDDSPRSFADAKLVTYGTALVLLVVVFFLSLRALGPGVAAASAILLGLMANLVMMSAGLVHDILFSTLVFASVYAIFAWQERGFVWWLGAGGLIGLAYLTKGIGHLLFVPLVAVGLHRHRLRFFRKSILYAALLGFVAVAFFLLWRNLTVYGNPVHNFSIRAAWIDDWEDVWTLSRSPEWSHVGLGWYLERHSIVDLAVRTLKGFGITLGLFVYSAGLGAPRAIVPCVVTGAAVLGLAAWGLVRRYRAGHRLEALAVGYTAAVFFLGFSFGAQAGLVAPRYMFPIVVLCVPWAGLALGQRPVVQGVAALVLVGRLAWFGGALTTSPRTYFGVPDAWHRTSLWLSAHLQPGERFAVPYHSYYSTWDRPIPDTDPRWSYAYRTAPETMLRQMEQDHIDKVLVDLEDEDLASYREKLSPASDLHGPLDFLGWPRCFADDESPSRFLVYCR